MSSDLNDLDKDKLKTLCESISASNFDEYKTKVNILKKKFITEEKEVKDVKDTSDVLLESIEGGVNPVSMKMMDLIQKLNHILTFLIDQLKNKKI